MEYKSKFLKDLQKRMIENSFFHLTDTKEEKTFIRENNCTYKIKFVYGGIISTIKDKKTLEKLEIQVIKEN